MSAHAAKVYRIATAGGSVKVTDDEIRRGFPARFRLAKRDVLEVTAGETSMRNTSLTSTRATMTEVVVSLFLQDGSVKRLRVSRIPAAEIRAAFKLRGWPVSDGL